MGKKMLVYTCPMHPEVQQEQAGICPQCGMKLVAQKKVAVKEKHKDYKNHKGHKGVDKHKVGNHKGVDKHKGHSSDMFLRKLIITAILTIPIILYSEIIEIVLGWKAPEFPGVQYIILLFGSIVFFYGGGVFIRGAYLELR